MKPILRFFLLVLLYQLHGQNLQWGFGITGAGLQNLKAMKLYNGYLYCAGVYENTIDLDPGAGTFNITSNGMQDVFVVRYDTDGNFIDGFSIGGPGNEGGFRHPSLCFDPAGNYYLTYQFENTIDADPGAGTVSYTASGVPSSVVAKFTSEHILVWSFQLAAGTSETGNGIFADDKYVYITGFFKGTADFDPSPTGTANLSASVTGLFVAKYTNTGNYKWAFRFDNVATTATGNNIRVDANGYVVVGGYFRGTVDFDPSPTTDAFMTANSGLLDFYLARYDSTGAYQWANHTGGSADNISYALEFAGTDIIVGGYVQGTDVDLDPGPGTQLVTTGQGDAYLARFNSDGSLEWAKTFGGSEYEDVMSVAISSTGNILITGGFSTDTIDIDPGPGVANISINKTGNSFDGYLALFDGAGNYQWAMAFGDSAWDQGQSLVIDAYDNWYVGGWYGRQAIDIDPGGTTLITATDGIESLLFKLSPCVLMKPTLAASLQFKEDASVAIPCVLGQGTAVEYHWYKGGVLNTTETASSFGFSQIAFADEGIYQVKTTDACANNKWSSILNLGVIPTIKVYELISPNGDDKNEFFNIRNIDKFSDYQIVVFNRWGQQVFQSQNYANDWNGENLADGTYFYKVRVGEEEYKGSLLIKR